MTNLNYLLMVLAAFSGVLALHGWIAFLNARSESKDTIGFLEAETERLHEGLQEANDELTITKAFSVYLEQGRDEVRKTLAQMEAYAVDTERMYLETLRERDELQADIGLVAGRRAKWRERAEKAERDLMILADAGVRALYEEDMHGAIGCLEIENLPLEAEEKALHELYDDTTQALMYAEEERQALKGTVAAMDQITAETLEALQRSKMALNQIGAMVSEPSRLEELTQVGFGTDTLEGSVVELVAAGLQDFVALVNERNELIQALGDAQKAQGKPAVIASPADPFGLSDLPF